jgi:Fe-S cluster assembly iron-binding protein IscA
VCDNGISSLQRLKELHANEPSAEGNMLRLSVEAGGCSGFQYTFVLDNKKNADDRLVAMLLIEAFTLFVHSTFYDKRLNLRIDFLGSNEASILTTIILTILH